MIDNSKRPESEITDPLEIRESLRCLDRSTSYFWWNTIVMLILLLAAMVALSAPELLGRDTLPQQPDVTAIVRGLLALMLMLE